MEFAQEKHKTDRGNTEARRKAKEVREEALRKLMDYSPGRA